MAIEFKMPQLGESVVEGTISKWLKQAGDAVAEYEPLLEVVTDKVDTEVPSPVDGVLLEIRVAEGETVQVGAVIAVLGEAGEAAPGEAAPAAADEGAPVAELHQRPPARPEAGAPAAEATPDERPAGERPTGERPAGERPTGERPSGRSYLTPVVARIAAEEDVDLSQVEGTGRHGRITKKDIVAYLERRAAVPSRAQAPAEATTPGPAPAPTPAPARTPAPAAPVAAAGGDVEVPLSRMRQATVRHMRQSKDTAAHVTTFWEVDLSRVSAHRAAHKARYADEGVKLTFLPYLFQALVAAVKAYPMLNAVLAGDKMIYRRAVNVGMAVDLGEEGLIVPVVKGADERNLRGLARAIDDLATRARDRQLDPDDVQGGTITITNHGALGSLAGTPIIPMPQVAIMGVGAIQKRPVVVEAGSGDAIAVRPMVYLSLTFDHRAIDGATADRFMAVVKEYLEGYAP